MKNDGNSHTLHFLSHKPEQSRLAHWPPPHQGHDTVHVITRHEPGEPAKRAAPRGWRLTRAMFGEFDDEE